MNVSPENERLIDALEEQVHLVQNGKDLRTASIDAIRIAGAEVDVTNPIRHNAERAWLALEMFSNAGVPCSIEMQSSGQINPFAVIAEMLHTAAAEYIRRRV